MCELLDEAELPGSGYLLGRTGRMRFPGIGMSHPCPAIKVRPPRVRSISGKALLRLDDAIPAVIDNSSRMWGVS